MTKSAFINGFWLIAWFLIFMFTSHPLFAFVAFVMMLIYLLKLMGADQCNCR